MFVKRSTGHQRAFSAVRMRIGPTEINNHENDNFLRIKGEDQEETSQTCHAAEMRPSK